MPRRFAFVLVLSALAVCMFASCSAPASDEGGAAGPAAGDGGAGGAAEGWQSLIEGDSLSGWRVIGGGDFYVEDGMLVGEVTQDGGYLATNESYDDFVMVADVRVDTGINSGFQLRSRVLEDDTTMSFLNGDLERQERTWEAGRVTGYQIEVDPTERKWSGGLYEPSGRGWLEPLTDRPEAQAAFRVGDWNTYRMRLRGDSIQTWVNDVPIVSTTDTVNTAGFIGLQTHSAHSEEEVGKKIYWRNVRLRPLD